MPLILVGGLFGGLSKNTLGKNDHLIPNQGIWRSAWNGLLSGLFGGLFVGGLAYFQHSILRLFLWRAGYAPLRYVHFLDYATRCILLRRVGGGYIFVHRMLLDYFASQDSTSLLTKAGKPEQNSAPTAQDEVLS